MVIKLCFTSENYLSFIGFMLPTITERVGKLMWSNTLRYLGTIGKNIYV